MGQVKLVSALKLAQMNPEQRRLFKLSIVGEKRTTSHFLIDTGRLKYLKRQARAR